MIYHNEKKEYRVVYTDIRCANYETDEKLMPTGEPQAFTGDIQGFYTITERPIGATEWGEPKDFNGRCDYGGEVELILKNEGATPKRFEMRDIIELEKSFANFRNLSAAAGATAKTFVEFVDRAIERSRAENVYEGIDNNNNL